MKQLLYISLACFVLVTTACRKYVEIPAEQVRELKYTKDYQALLYQGSTLIEKTYGYPIYAADDIGSETATWQNALNIVVANAYTWAPKLVGQQEEEQDWANMYRAMLTINTVITEVMDSEGGTEAQKRAALSQALVHRAYLYLTLVNIYAKPYDPATAATDPGVPMLLDNRLTGSLQRWTVARVYEQVVKDIEAALPDLPAQPDVVTNPAKAAAFGVLARTYLNKREWADARRYADSALTLKSSLIDLNAYATSTTGFPRKINDPEIILSKVPNLFPVSLPLSDGIVSLLDTKDLRYMVYTAPGTQIPPANYTNRGFLKMRLTPEGLQIGITVPEMMLIKAEAEARLNNAAAAIDILNTLRKKRFSPADYTDLTASSPEEALRTVIDERRRELMGTGMRWFDQRRLQKDPSFNFVAAVTRTFKGVNYTLEPGSARYLFPIADKYITFNPEIEQNPR